MLAYLVGVALMTVFAGAATGELAVHHFGRIAYYGLATNLVAVPLIAIWIMPWVIVSMFLLPLGLEGYALVPMTAGIAVIMNVAYSVASFTSVVVFVWTESMAGSSIEGQGRGMALPVAGKLAFSWLHLWRAICKRNHIVEFFDFQIRRSVTRLVVGRLIRPFKYELRADSENQWLRPAGQNKSEYWAVLLIPMRTVTARVGSHG